MKKVILIGNGGHSRVIQEMINKNNAYELIGILDQSVESFYKEESVIYDNTDNLSYYKQEASFVLAIGDNKTRKKIMKENNLEPENFATIIDPSAIVATDVSIGAGTVVMPGAVINTGTIIGNHTIINTRAVVEHDNVIEDFVHISPNATLTGTVRVRNFSHIGAGAIVIPNKTIYENVSVGAGAVVVEDAEKNTVIVGVPAKIIKRRS
ncbi:NeuD/PglB/VioB family sugar acetyltransferase [Salinicoccus bachuensis]|uniref:NeuD/PglB/VioB family sugar acetyltransferase n=1 Tax=Salinicoccus bachuensis TaxID=3136731 RepID=A0ABZ3CJT6_9STAP